MVWWALYSEHGRALLARDELAQRGFPVFCPVEKLTRRRKVANRNQYRPETVVSPVFGRYLFAVGEVVDLLAVRGVGDVVRAGLEPLEVPSGVVSEMRGLTRLVDGVGDLIGARDVTRLSLGFKGRVGSSFKFRGGALEGFVGVITSLARLDSHGEVKAYVDLLGGRCEVTVSHSVVGPMVPQGKMLIAA